MAQQISFRTERVNELIKRELVLLLSKETKDPRLQEVVITDVIVTRDLTSAKVFSQSKSFLRNLSQLCLIRLVVFLENLYQKL